MPDYEITITVSPTHQVCGEKYGKMLASKQWDYLQFYIYETFKKYDIEYEIYPEFHKNFSIHVHGHAIVPLNMNKFDIVDISKRFNQLGRSNFKPLSNKLSWLIYICKDYGELGKRFSSPNYNPLNEEERDL